MKSFFIFQKLLIEIMTIGRGLKETTMDSKTNGIS